MEVLAVGPVDGLLVLEALEHHERRVQEGHREQDQGKHEGHHGRRLHRRLDRDGAHQQAEQVGAAVSHEARGGREVEDQEPQRRAGRERREHARLRALQIERDHRHRDGDDHAHARRQPVDAVGEVDHVHHQHEADHGEDRPRVGGAGVGEMKRADPRQRDRLHRDAEVHHDHRREHLTGELQHGGQLEAVVERAHERDHAGAQQHALPQVRLLAVARGQPDQPRGERSAEDREAPEQGRGAVRQAPLARLVDRADGGREAHRERRQQRGHGRRGEEREDGVELARMRHLRS